MKLGLKLLLAPLATAAVMLAATAGSAVVAVRHYWQVVADADAQVTTFQALAARTEQITQAHAAAYRTVALIASLDEAQTKAARAALAQRLGGVKKAFADLAATDAEDVALGAIAAEAGKQIDAYVKHADMAIDLASVDPNTGVAALQSADSAFTAVAAKAAHIVEHAKARSTMRAEAERARARMAIGLLTLFGLGMTALALALTVRLQRRLVADLDAARAAAQQVAAGDLQHTLVTERGDELGELMRAVAAMQSALRAIVAEVRDSAHAFQGATGEMAQGNADLSQRTEESASSLQQTAASMTQIGGAVRQSADQAQAALRLAGDAAQVAERGGTVVGNVVGTMNRIDEASRRIADIIGSIDGIAFQTNILALNAAVEAARAGEQGRGFAVVAGEVRALAQRSAQAAKEIKALIGASVEQVASGTRLVADAGSTMADIVASVQRVTQVIGEISSAAAQQSAGLSEVGSAVAQLDAMTQQNAALVEQSAAASKSLEDQAARLAGSVATFKL